jgi:hypothetical protein
MMNLDLEKELDERGLSITIHPTGTGWVVWLFPADDPAQLVVTEGKILARVIEEALREWDGGGASVEGEEPAETALRATKLPGGGRGWRRPGAVLEPGEEWLVPEKQPDGTVMWRERDDRDKPS